MKFNYIILLAGMLAATEIQAQTNPADTTLNRTVVVEQEYNPDIMDARKINVVPQVVAPTVKPREVEYDASDLPARSIPGTPMAAYAGKEIQEKTRPGYARFGYGNNNNLDAKANYLFDFSKKDKLNLGFSMDGMKADVDSYDKRFSGAEKWNQYYYQTRAGLDYLHNFSGVDLHAGGNFGVSNFNYQSLISNISRQRFTSGDVKVALASTTDNLPFHFRVGSNVLFFSRQYNPSYFQRNRALKETLVRTHAEAWSYISEYQRVGVYGMLDNRMYSDGLFKDNTALTLSPYYNFENDNWKVTLGANVDLGFSFGKKVQFSPNIFAEYIFADSYIGYVKATGGRIKNDFRRFENLNPYALFSDKQLEDSYEQINTTIGFKASPIQGLWFNVFGGYQNIKRDLGYMLHRLEDGHYMGDVLFLQSNTNNTFAGVQASYEYKDLFTGSAQGKFYNWDAKDDAVLITKPQFSFDLQGTARIIPDLYVNLGFELITRKKVKDVEKMKSVGNLSLGATYNLTKDISIYVRTSNLLNKDYCYYNYYQAQGINFLGGLSFKF